ncbi:MAG: cation diffusion facilitator family transporter [Pseudomonadota bacterium]
MSESGHGQQHHNPSGRIGLVFFLNAGFTVIEFVGGWLTNSTAIMADAVHDLGDTLSIGSAWLLARLGERSPDDSFTYGYRRLSLFGALLNSLVLVGASVWVLGEAVPRLFDPVMPHAQGMLGLAVLGVIVNGVAAWRLSEGRTLNERVLNWHLLEDVLGWVAVLVVAIALQFVDWPILDPLLSIGFTLFILANVVRMLWSTGRLFFQAVPDRTMQREIRQTLLALDDVDEVHHLHLWSLDGEHHVLTAHLVVPGELPGTRYNAIKQDVAAALEPYSLAHTTIELEAEQEFCRDDTVV